MSLLVPLASGKGGVGKSVLAANLSLRLAASGKSVILVDLDWGGSNAHTILGVLNNQKGIGDYVIDKGQTLADLVVPLDTPGLSFIPGDGLIAGAANVPMVRKQKLLRELAALEADYVVLDLGAGSHLATIDVFLASPLGLVVTTPEPTAVLNAYSFLKTALYRLLLQSVPPKSEARARLQEFFTGRSSLTGGQGLDQLVMQLASLEPLHGERLTQARRRLRPRVVLNEAMDASELTLGARLRQVCERQLGLGIEYVGLIPFDASVRKSVIDRKPAVVQNPTGPFSRAVGLLADRLIHQSFAAEPPMGTFADLEDLAAQDDSIPRG